MFEQAMLASAPVGNRLLSTCAGVSGQVLLVGGLILAPLLFPQVLPQVQSMVSLVAPGPPPPPPAPGPTVRPRSAVAPTRVFRCTFCAPVRVPDKIEIVNEDPPAYADTVGVPGGIPGGVPGGGGNELIRQIMGAGDAPPPPPVRVVPQHAVQVVPKGPVSVDLIPGGRVRLAHPIHRVEPIYPALARQMRVAGTVELEGIIAVDGHLRALHVKSGPALLVQAAMDAVKQWIYEPTTLNEQPVEVIAPITVTFRLN